MRRHVALTALIMTLAGAAQAEEPANAEQLARHFHELTMAVDTTGVAATDSRTPVNLLRWDKTKLTARFLSGRDNMTVSMAKGGSGLLMGAMSNVLEIEDGPVAIFGTAEISEALTADLVFLVSEGPMDNAKVLFKLLPPLKSAGLTWIEDPEGLGPGCGATIGYNPANGKIGKAYLTIDASAVYRPLESPTNKRNQRGLLFDCVNRQLMAGLGLLRDWGRQVSRVGHSVFGPPTRDPPLDDMRAIEILYQPAFSKPLTQAKIGALITAQTACLAATKDLCKAE
jgi:hypothetical protein